MTLRAHPTQPSAVSDSAGRSSLIFSVQYADAVGHRPPARGLLQGAGRCEDCAGPVPVPQVMQPGPYLGCHDYGVTGAGHLPGIEILRVHNILALRRQAQSPASQFMVRGCGVARTAQAGEARRGQQRTGRHRQQPRRGIRGRA